MNWLKINVLWWCKKTCIFWGYSSNLQIVSTSWYSNMLSKHNFSFQKSVNYMIWLHVSGLKCGLSSWLNYHFQWYMTMIFLTNPALVKFPLILPQIAHTVIGILWHTKTMRYLCRNYCIFDTISSGNGSQESHISCGIRWVILIHSSLICNGIGKV